MRNKVARKLWQKANRLSKHFESEKDNIVHKRRMPKTIGKYLKDSIINLVTVRYKEGSPVTIYRRLKKEWNNTPKNERRLENYV